LTAQHPSLCIASSLRSTQLVETALVAQILFTAHNAERLLRLLHLLL
jgi:hypothetical protein